MVPPYWFHLSDGMNLPVMELGANCVNGSARLGGVGPPEPEAAAVQLVSPGLGLCCYEAGDGLALLSVVKLGSDSSLADGVQVGIDDDDAQDGVLVIGSVQLEAGAAEVLAVDKNLQTALRVLGGGMAPAGQLLGAGRTITQTG